MPTELPLTRCELPESPPIGAPSPAEAEVVAAGFEDLVPEASLSDAPGKSGIVGFTIPISVFTGASGFWYRLPSGVWRPCSIEFTRSLGMYACARVVMNPIDSVVSYGIRAFILI